MATTHPNDSASPSALLAGGNMVLRLGLGTLLGLFVTVGLLWAMQFLISIGDDALSDEGRLRNIEFVRVKRDESVKRREEKPEKPPQPEAPPETPPTPQLDEASASVDKISVGAPTVQTEIDLTGGFSLGVGEGDYLPIVKVAPIYPDRALSRGIEGFCIVEYTVTRQGTVKDVRVIESQCSSALFHRSSIQAAEKFKYKPRVIDGQAIEVPGVQNRFTYQIEN